MEHLSRSAIVLWAAGLVMNVVLLTVLFWKRRAGEVPWFTAWVAWAVVTSVGLYLGRARGIKPLYASLYWTAAFVEVVLELAVVFELAAIVFRRSGSWVDTSRTRLAARAGASALLALVLTLVATPAASSPRDALYSHISLFETILFTGLFLTLMTVSQELGVSWRDLVVREGAGFLLLNLCAFFTDTLHVYWRTASLFGGLEHLRMTVYLAVLTYWIVVFWLPERSRGMLDPRTSEKLAGFHDRQHARDEDAGSRPL